MFRFFRPRWLKQLPATIRLDDQQVSAVEKFRRSGGHEDDDIAAAVAGSNWAARQSQEGLYQTILRNEPRLSEKEALARLIDILERNAKAAGMPVAPDAREALQQAPTFEAWIQVLFAIRREAEPLKADPLKLRPTIEALLADPNA